MSRVEGGVTVRRRSHPRHFFKEEQVDKLKATFKESGAPFEVKIYPDTAHGFGARPTPTHEPTMAAFNDANERAGDFAKKYLGL